MLNIGPQELLLILVVALVVVGPQRLPELSRSIGKALRSLRAAQDEVRKTVNEVLEPQVVAEATTEVRKARDEVRDALRPDLGVDRASAPRAAAGRPPGDVADASPTTEPSEQASEPATSPDGAPATEVEG